MRVAREGDLVLLLSSDGKRYQVRLKRGAVMHTHRGKVAHDELIGQPLGRQVRSHLGQPFLIFEPSTGDLIRQARRVTQIMFPKDIGYLLLRLNIYPGVRVVEAGTGSGGLTIALARAVQPDGHVYSYEQRADVQRVARENIESLGLSGLVTFWVRDVGEGFVERDVDALFLDLRDPWNYIAPAHDALKAGGFLGAIMPTANQVAHLLHDLRGGGFAALEVEELILRPYKPIPARLRPADRMVAHTGYLVFARKVVGEIEEGWYVPTRGRDRAARRGALDDYW